ncbi:MAG: cold shock domain-containing protein [Thermoplasmatales archaeon]|nr:MAG: cold shock domain-containing protein [Thermoplasmatales archaeon]
MKGTVKWYNGLKGFGFIQGEDGTDVFVHRTAIPMGTDLYEGDSVEYQVEDSERGQRATDVKMLKNA